MMTVCTVCQRSFNAAPEHLQLQLPPTCLRCQEWQQTRRSRPVAERVRFDDRPGEAPLKERELRECN